MKSYIYSFFIIILISSCEKDSYMDSTLSSKKRAALILEEMTLEEKVGQMVQYTGIDHFMKNKSEKFIEIIKNGDSKAVYENENVETILRKVNSGQIGSFLHIESPEEANLLQKEAERSRLKIPLLIAVDAIHGHGFYPPGATIFPSPIGLSCSFDTALVRKIAEVTAMEMRATGFHWNFSPMIEVARDARWGRIGETYGEDPLLCSLFGEVTIKGYQGKNMSNENNVAACAKHFVAGAEPVNGLNFAPMDVSERMLREIWFPPYKKAVEANVATFMAAHPEINGIPCHANKWLLRDVLKNEWGFNGFVVSDWKDVYRLHTLHNVAGSIKEADKIAVEAGIDMNMHGPGFYDEVVELVKEGKLDEKLIDESVKKILTLKFQLGLFENRYVDINKVSEKILTKEHKELAYKAALASIVLLENRNNILPLHKKIKKILVTGPHADNQMLLGDWTRTQNDTNVITVYEGIRNRFKNAQVDHLYCGEFGEIKDRTIQNIAKKSLTYDVAILAVGENSFRDSKQLRTCGENHARSEISLYGKQLQLIKKIKSKGIPVIVLLINGRPLSISWCKKNADAVIETWEPGMMGGKAIAEIIAGDYCPSGKLTITFPLSTGHIGTFYNHKPSMYMREYMTTPTENLYNFGYSLSYTSFEYSELKVSKTHLTKHDTLNIRVNIKNTGDFRAKEIILTYINDKISSVTTPVKQLKHFIGIILEPGQRKTVDIQIPVSELSLLNAELERVVEPGEFEIMIENQKKTIWVTDRY